MTQPRNYELQLVQALVEIRYLSFLWWDRRGRITGKLSRDFETMGLPISAPVGFSELQLPLTFDDPGTKSRIAITHERLVYSQTSDAIDPPTFAGQASRYLRLILDELEYQQPANRLGARFFYRIVTPQSISDFILDRLAEKRTKLPAESVGTIFLIQTRHKGESGHYIVTLSVGVNPGTELPLEPMVPLFDLDYYQEKFANLRDLHDFIIQGNALSQKVLPQMLEEVYQ